MTEIYISTDIESDGPIPGPNSMLSYGSAAFLSVPQAGGYSPSELVGTFSSNLELLPGAVPNPGTMAWWGKPEQQAAWKACREDLDEPAVSLPRYVAWVEAIAKKFNAKPVFVAYPAGFDFLFMYWYMMCFAGTSPFSFSALDIKTYAMAVLGGDYRDATKKNMPKAWFPKSRHTHVALDDAIEQGELFMNIRRACMQLHAGGRPWLP